MGLRGRSRLVSERHSATIFESTPMAKRIVVAKFKHPSVVEGNVHFENEIYPVKKGVVECPVEIGQNAEWHQLSEAELKDYDKAVKTVDDQK
jgi:hypothetical protein